MDTVILVDTSWSMTQPVMGGQRRDVLSTILKNIVGADGHRIFAFSDEVVPLEPGQPLPQPDGGTNLALALTHVATLSPKRVVVISDGMPNDPVTALAAARALKCVITTYHCGDEFDKPAISFLRSLALCSRGGVGRPLLADLRKPEKLAGELRLLLAAPS
jgi:uncharacterized protein (DUF58 family)